ncbi:hypothetical protein AMATHDRAFT_66593, partial [Amanita thiersii Skay4041]
MGVITVYSEGYINLQVLQKLAAGTQSFLRNNHTLPILDELQKDTTSPKVGGTIVDTFMSWVKNFVGDLMDML